METPRIHATGLSPGINIWYLAQVVMKTSFWSMEMSTTTVCGGFQFAPRSQTVWKKVCRTIWLLILPSPFWMHTPAILNSSATGHFFWS